jgi:diacylglycerol O-acyltransferase / wax synthase
VPDFYYEPLSYLDSSFLALESRTTHMHVAGVAVFEANELGDGNGGIDFQRVRAHIEAKLQYIPRYRQRLGYVPYNRSPVWVDDDHFNFDYHVRHTSLPRPGSDDQLKALAGRIVSQQLDRDKPLWELWVVEGLRRTGSPSSPRSTLHDRRDRRGRSHHDPPERRPHLRGRADTPERPRPAPTGTQLAVAEIAKATWSGSTSVADAAGLVRQLAQT